MYVDNLVLKAKENGKRRLSSANSSFSSYDGGDADDNDGWGIGVNGDADKISDKSNYSAMNSNIIFDDKYEFLDHTILGEVTL